VQSRSFWQRGWDRFDSLSNLQTVALLSALVIGLVATAALLTMAAISPRAHTSSQPAIAEGAKARESIPSSVAALPAGLTPAASGPIAPAVPALAVDLAPNVGSIPAAVPPPPAEVIAAPPSQAMTDVRSVSLAVNLRAAPNRTAPFIATLPAGAEVTLLRETATSDDGTWQRVRTGDAREGWIIASALE